MFKLFDRVKVNIPTTGTGDVTFGSASSNAFLTPAEAGCADGDTVRYVIVDGTDYEEGIGTIASSVVTMARTTVTKSKIAGTAGTTKLNLSGAAVLALVSSGRDILIPANNLSDLDDAAAARTNLGGTAVGKEIFTAADAAAARSAIVGATRTITGADTIVASDIGKTLLFNSSSAFTLAITAAATLGNGFWCRFKNINAGLVTIDPNSSETIDGATTSLSPKGDQGIIVCDGTGFQTLERPAEILLASGSVSNSANLVLTLPRGCRVAKFKLSNVNPVTNGSALQMEMSTNGGSSYVNTYDRAYGGVDTVGGTASWAKGNSQAKLILTSSMDNTGYNNVIEIDMPYEVALVWTPVKIFAAYRLQSAGWDMRLSAAGAAGGGIITHVRFSMDSGNISTMDYQVVGARFG